MENFKNLLNNKDIYGIKNFINNSNNLKLKDHNGNTPLHLLIKHSIKLYNKKDFKYSQILQNLFDSNPHKNKYLNMNNNNNEQIILNTDYSTNMSDFEFSDTATNQLNQNGGKLSTDIDFESNSLENININSLTFSEEEHLYFENESNKKSKKLKGGGKRRSRRNSRSRRKSRSRKSSRRSSRRRRSKRRKLKRKLNAFFIVLTYYREKNKNNSNLSGKDFGKNAGIIYRKAKSQLGNNAKPDEIIKLAKSMIDKS